MFEAPMDTARYLPLLLPIVLISLGLDIFSLIDLSRRNVTRGPKWAWAMVILLVNPFGAILYLLVGRKDD
jgi:hypothetical protein